MDPLQKIYPFSTPLPGASCFSPSDEQLQKLHLTCMPLLKKEDFYEPLQGLYSHKWWRQLSAFAIFSFNSPLYQQTCEEDVKCCVETINALALDSKSRYSNAMKAFLIHSLLAHIISYRAPHYFEKNPGIQLILPVYLNGEYVLKPCSYRAEINLFGGVMSHLFHPCDRKGSATLLFKGTAPWMCASGAGIGLADDLNPLGPGQALRAASRTRLKPILEECQKEYGENTLLVGHSLGGILATCLAVDLPDLISQVMAFSPTRMTHQTASKWRALQSSALSRLPTLYTFLSCFENGGDIFSTLGSQWIGNVYHVHHKGSADLIQRHTFPLGIGRGELPTLKTVDVESENQTFLRRTVWFELLHQIVVLPLAITFLALLVFKRFFFGWEQGGIWRWGVFGVPVTSLTSNLS